MHQRSRPVQGLRAAALPFRHRPVLGARSDGCVRADDECTIAQPAYRHVQVSV